MLVQIFFTCMMRAMLHNKTPEQRKAIAAKGVATRKANREAAAAARLAAYQRVAGLRDQIEALEQKLASLERLEKMSAVSATLTGKALLRPDAIAKAAIPWKRSPGVYFLLGGSNFEKGVIAINHPPILKLMRNTFGSAFGLLHP